eukprot:29017-Pelagococcus_subviridis.AAC.1
MERPRGGRRGGGVDASGRRLPRRGADVQTETSRADRQGARGDRARGERDPARVRRSVAESAARGREGERGIGDERSRRRRRDVERGGRVELALRRRGQGGDAVRDVGVRPGGRRGQALEHADAVEPVRSRRRRDVRGAAVYVSADSRGFAETDPRRRRDAGGEDRAAEAREHELVTGVGVGGGGARTGRRRIPRRWVGTFSSRVASVKKSNQSRTSSSRHAAYVFSRYSTIAADSNIATPVFGSSMYGAWNLPLLSINSWRFGDPRPDAFRRCGSSSSTSFSRTSLQNGLASYE